MSTKLITFVILIANAPVKQYLNQLVVPGKQGRDLLDMYFITT